jgi:hypothetical protein
MKIASLLFLFLLFSCATVKFHTMEFESSPRELKGSVKSLEMTTLFLSKEGDTIENKQFRNFYYDKKNNLLKEQYLFEKFSDETVYNYNSEGLIESSITKEFSSSRNVKSEFEYDENRNCICIRNFGGDTLYTIKTSKYDNNNNVIEEEYKNLINKNNNARVKYIYDYNKKTCLLKTFDADNNQKNTILEFHYNKKGYIMNLNSINSKTNLTQYISYKYDRFGNSISYLSLDKKKNSKISNVYQNEYDRKGNLIKRETFTNGKLIEKSIMDITYW